jgi:2-polyprenyl-3-methyl-5-hydroxy-6-metoxy-1,4-benzoquinol methylase
VAQWAAVIDERSAPRVRPAPYARPISVSAASGEQHDTALAAASPRPALSWVEIGCGTGAVLRAIRDRHRPSRLCGTDVNDWLDDDLRDDVEMYTGPAEETLAALEPADRVLMVEVLEHLESPWTVLRAAARLVAHRGRMVVTTPSVGNLRHRVELLLRGNLTSFRPDNVPHLQPALPHVVERVLSEEGLKVERGYAGADIIPFTRGRIWPAGATRRAPHLTSVSVVFVASRAG